MWDGERAHSEAVNKKMGIFLWAGSSHYRLEGRTTDGNHGLQQKLVSVTGSVREEIRFFMDHVLKAIE